MTKRRNRRNYRPRCQALESRRLLSADLNAFFETTIHEGRTAKSWAVLHSTPANAQLGNTGIGPSLVESVRGIPQWEAASVVDFFFEVDFDRVAQETGADSDEFTQLIPLVEQPGHTRVTVNDPLFQHQWHLDNRGQSGGRPGQDANLGDVWDSYRGEGVVIGIVDDGVQWDHPDLRLNFRADLSYDLVDNDSDPNSEFADDGHGTAVAGVAAAVGDNSEGVTGVAPSADIAGLRLLGGGLHDLKIASAIYQQMANVDISNNSWGAADVASIDSQLGATLTHRAIADATEDGRDGLGTVIVWAAGNGGHENDNVNYDLLANSRHTIAVGAVNHLGNRAFYSEPGAALLVTAPSGGDGVGVTTTDLVGLDGYNVHDTAGLSSEDSRNYTDQFGGTSSAAPLVSGVIALMLDANPDLSWRDVQAVLADTSRVTDSSNPDWQLNGGNHWVSHEYGHGVVDANAAVNAALGFQGLPDEVSVSTGYVPVGEVIPDASYAGLGHVTEVDQRIVIESVELFLDATHDRRGDLAIELVSPSGTVSYMADPRSDAGEDYGGYRFVSQLHRDEFSDGQWMVRARDVITGETGRLNGYELVLHGHDADGVPDRQSPRVTQTNPSSLEIGVPITVGLHMEFDEAVKKGTGQIVVHRASNGSVVEQIDVNSGQVDVAGSSVIMEFSDLLDAETPYYVRVDAGAFVDLSDNPFTGFVGHDGWIFLTGPETQLDVRSTVESIAENTDVNVDLAIATIAIEDPNAIAGPLSLSGPNVDNFQIANGNLFLLAGTTLDYETDTVLLVNVDLADRVNGDLLDRVVVELDVVNVNDVAPVVSVDLYSQTVSDSLDVSGQTPLGKIAIDDDSGVVNLSLSGSDAALFSIVGDELVLNSGVSLDATQHARLNVTVAADDPTIGGTPDHFVDVELAVVAAARTIFFEDFESGILSGDWTVSAEQYTRLEVIESADVGGFDLGGHSLVIDHVNSRNTFGSAGTLAFDIDLGEVFDVSVAFDFDLLDQQFDSDHDHLSISYDGQTWFPIFNFDRDLLGSGYQSAIVDVSAFIDDLIDQGVPQASNDGVISLRFGNQGFVSRRGATGRAGGMVIDNVDVTARPVVGQSKPSLGDQQFFVDEGVDAGTIVGEILATDAEDDLLEFRVLGGDTLGVFTIDGASLVVARPELLRYQLRDQYELEIRVTDDGIPRLSDTANITVDLNDLGLSSRVFFDDFESGTPSEQWDEISLGYVSTDHGPIAGSHHLVLENARDLRRDTVHYAEFHFNSFAFSDPILVFSHKEVGHEADSSFTSVEGQSVLENVEGDGLLLSTDGQSWYEVISLTGEDSPSESRVFAVDIEQFAAEEGLILGSETRLRFNRFATSGSRGNPADRGLAFDDVVLSAIPLPVVPLTISGPSSPSAEKPLEFTLTFTEPVNGLTLSDISVDNGAISEFSRMGSLNYRLVVSPTADGLLTVTVSKDAAQGATTGNPTLAASAQVNVITPAIILSLDEVVVEESSSLDADDGTEVVEVRLNSKPETPVYLNVESSDSSQLAAFPIQLVFTAENWDQPQPVTVSAVDDHWDDGDIESTLRFSVQTENSDVTYVAVSSRTIDALAVDNDQSGFVLSDSEVRVFEDGIGAAEVGVRLTSQPTDQVVISVVSEDPTETTVSTNQLVFTPEDWDHAKQVVINGVDDAIDDGSQDSRVRLSVDFANSDASYSVVGDQWVEVTTAETPPRIEYVAVNEGQSQRSHVTSIKIGFNQLVDPALVRQSLSVSDIGTGENVGLALVVNEEQGKSTVMIEFAGGDSVITREAGNSLMDGRYRLSVRSDQVRAVDGGQTMPEDFVFGDSPVDALFRLFGDADGDGDVDSSDLGKLAEAFLSRDGMPNYSSVFDAEGDGDVDAVDLGRFGTNFLTNLF